MLNRINQIKETIVLPSSIYLTLFSYDVILGNKKAAG